MLSRSPARLSFHPVDKPTSRNDRSRPVLVGPVRPVTASIDRSRFSGEYNLTISPVTLDDDGVYQCQVGVGKRDEPAIRSRKATLTVLVAPDRPRIVQGETVTAAESVPVELECVSEGGKPPAEVSADFQYSFFPTVANFSKTKNLG